MDEGAGSVFARASALAARLGPGGVRVVCLLLLAGIALLDSRLPPLLSLSVLYVLPGLLAASTGLAAGLAMTALSVATWCAVDVFDPDTPFPSVWIPVANAAMRAVVFAGVVWLTVQLDTRRREERELARRDPLTGLVNSRAFYDEVERARQRLQRAGRPVTLAFLDLDDFKGVNDRLGHAAGDAVLREAAAALQAAVRSVDTVARVGGDEFAVLLPETDETEAGTVLERVRVELHADGLGKVTGVSIGAVTFAGVPVSCDAMVAAADRVMYEVKRTGKDGLRLVTA